MMKRSSASWKPPIPEKLFGEHRGFGSGLFVDLVPRSAWFTNLRSCVSKTDWQRIHDMVVQRAGNRCEICGSSPDPEQRLWMEAHERWEYDNVLRTQTLRRLICLCTRCHLATHFGYAKTQGRERQAMAHLMGVNRWNAEQAAAHVNSAFDLWRKRSSVEWHLDLSMLLGAEVEVREPPDPSERRRQAEDRTRDVRRNGGLA